MTTTLKCGRGGPRLKFECEFCGEFAIASAERTVCDGCDSALAATQEKELADKAKRWALSHKCRQCGDGLPLSRYFDCEDCLKDQQRESESEWDSVPALDDEGDTCFTQPTKVLDSKLCRGCGVTRPISAYAKDKWKSDGFSTQCVECRRVQYANRRAREAAASEAAS